jgi:penicillin-binding protein 1A
MEMGVENVYKNFKSYGYTSLVDLETRADGSVFSDMNTSPLALGGLTYGVSVREHTQAYATLANNGVTSKARTYSVVRDSTGRVILDNSEKHDVMYKETTTAILTNMLTHVVTGSYGTARSRINFYKKYGVEVAGKTGTTSDKKDVYFAGYTPDFVACCWYGYDLNQVITTSGNSAASLWNSVFDEIYKYYKDNGISYTKKFEYPSSMVTAEYCTISGKIPTEACRNDLYHKKGGMSCIAKGMFNKLEAPTEYCDAHVMVKWDKVTNALCLDGCECPAANLVDVGLRKLTIEDRALKGKVTIGDAQFTYMDVPADYVYPTGTGVPFFQNALPEGYSFGYSSAKPSNRICIEHYDKNEPDDPFTPDTSVDPDASAEPDTPDEPAVPAG